MITHFRFSLPAAAVLVLFAAGSPASAQSVPTPTPDVSRQGVRDILNRAENEGARRTVGDILGGLAGISQARAQTAPTQPPAAPVAQPVAEVSAASAPATVTGPQPVIQAAPTAPAAAPPNAVVAQTGSGTPADPNMIVRVPAETAATPGAGAVGQQAPVSRGVATQSAAPGPAVAVPVPATSGPTVLAQASQPAVGVIRRPHGHYGSRAWCPPSRW